MSDAEAQRLVGQFLQNFALLEQALNAGIGKILDLNAAKTEIVCASIPYARKVELFFAAELHSASMPDLDRQKLLKEARGAALDLNKSRVIFAHHAFSSDGKDGVRFVKVTNAKLEVSNVKLSPKEVEKLCERARETAARINLIAAEMKPYKPSLDFSDPRNSGYLVLLNLL